MTTATPSATSSTPTRPPVLYLSHGAPPLADDATWTGQLGAWGADLAKPEAVLIVSAHWELAPLAVSATSGDVPLLYDFWGFPQHYYEVTYDAPGAPGLARSVARLMGDAGEQLHQDPARGLDHGAYVPLKEMFPEADVPVLQLSMPTLDPQRLFELGRRLAPAARRGRPHRRLGVHDPQPRVVQPRRRRRTPPRPRPRASSTTGPPRPSARATSTPSSTSSPRPPPPARPTRAPSTGRRSTSPSAPRRPRAPCRRHGRQRHRRLLVRPEQALLAVRLTGRLPDGHTAVMTTTGPTVEDHLATIATSARHLATWARAAGTAAPVPTCPGLDGARAPRPPGDGAPVGHRARPRRRPRHRRRGVLRGRGARPRRPGGLARDRRGRPRARPRGRPRRPRRPDLPRRGARTAASSGPGGRPTRPPSTPSTPCPRRRTDGSWPTTSGSATPPPSTGSTSSSWASGSAARAARAPTRSPRPSSRRRPASGGSSRPGRSAPAPAASTADDDVPDGSATLRGTPADLYLALWNRGGAVDDPAGLLAGWHATGAVSW